MFFRSPLAPPAASIGAWVGPPSVRWERAPGPEAAAGCSGRLYPPCSAIPASCGSTLSAMSTPKRGLEAADVFGLLGALIQAVIVGVGALLIVVGLLYGVTSWIAGL